MHNALECLIKKYLENIQKRKKERENERIFFIQKEKEKN